MDKYRIINIALILFSVFVVSVYANENEEPLLEYELIIDDKKTSIKPYQEVKLNGVSENPTIKLVPKSYRRFDYGGVQFNYPSDFAFEADFSNENVKIWSLDGKDAILMLQVYKQDNVQLKDIVDVMLELYKGNAKAKDSNKIFNKHRLKSAAIEVKLLDFFLKQEILKLPSSNGSKFLVIQESIDKNEVSEEEKNFMFTLLNQTLNFN